MDVTTLLAWAVVIFLLAGTGALIWIMVDLNRMDRRIEASFTALEAELAAELGDITRDINAAKETRQVEADFARRRRLALGYDDPTRDDIT